VTATGVHTKFGRTAELVRTAHVVSSQQKAVLRIVRNLAIFNGVVILLIGAYAYAHAMPWRRDHCPAAHIGPCGGTGSVARNIHPCRSAWSSCSGKARCPSDTLSAVGEAATFDVLCSDKTGTLTCNQFSVTSVRPMPGFDEAHVLAMAALASSEGGQDSVDAAIHSAASQKPASDLPKLTKFVPFDPAKKTSEAIATAPKPKGGAHRIIKGAFTVVIGLTAPAPTAIGIADELEKQGFRVLAVAAGPSACMRLIGLIALSDPPRKDSTALISELHTLGVRTVMVTGDAPATAAIVADAVGLEGAVYPPGPIPDAIKPQDFSVFAGILPEGKYNLVKAFQKNGHTVGMCGDGANDAPALRQAQIGIAVSSATDVAKSAAGVVLREAGLSGVVAAAMEGRVTFQRILTYTLNSVIKKTVQVLFLAVGLVMTGHAVLTPMLMVIVMITGDFLAMSLTTDRVRPSVVPNAWQIGRITSAGVILGGFFLAFCSGLGRWQIRNGTRSGGTENSFGRCRRLWQPSHDLCDTRTPSAVGIASDQMAGPVLCGRSSYYLDVGSSWDCDGATTPLSAGW
jgi:H+-transporting ATPase